jgi:anti-sigma B factor antagonist
VHTSLDITLRWSGRQRAIVVSGELTVETATPVEALLSIVCADDAAEVELDLRDLTFIDSAGIRVILLGKAACAERGCEFFLIPSRAPQAARIWEVTGLREQLSWREGPPPGAFPRREDQQT